MQEIYKVSLVRLTIYKVTVAQDTGHWRLTKEIVGDLLQKKFVTYDIYSVV